MTGAIDDVRPMGAPRSSTRRNGRARDRTRRSSGPARRRVFSGSATGRPSSPTFTKTTSASVTFTTLPHSRQRSAVTVTFTVIDVVPIFTTFA